MIEFNRNIFSSNSFIVYYLLFVISLVSVTLLIRLLYIFMKPIHAAIALGSNLGDSRKTVKTAVEILNNTATITVKSISSWYQTAPVGPPQPDYINGCAIVELQPQYDTLKQNAHALHQILLKTEAKFGRVRRERWGPRTLDLDLLLLNQLILETPTLQIPHPRMAQRAFVLIPLAEIAPDWIDPVSGKAIAQLRETVDCTGVKKIND
jgi:2-amino-4-hydroxy-6-hydroxymethyldihydropteridine diphosphokinase